MPNWAQAHMLQTSLKGKQEQSSKEARVGLLALTEWVCAILPLPIIHRWLHGSEKKSGTTSTHLPCPGQMYHHIAGIPHLRA